MTSSHLVEMTSSVSTYSDVDASSFPVVGLRCEYKMADCVVRGHVFLNQYAKRIRKDKKAINCRWREREREMLTSLTADDVTTVTCFLYSSGLVVTVMLLENLNSCVLKSWRCRIYLHRVINGGCHGTAAWRRSSVYGFWHLLTYSLICLPCFLFQSVPVVSRLFHSAAKQRMSSSRASVLHLATDCWADGLCMQQIRWYVSFPLYSNSY